MNRGNIIAFLLGIAICGLTTALLINRQDTGNEVRKTSNQVILQPAVYMQNELSKPKELDTATLLNVLEKYFEPHAFELHRRDLLSIDSLGPYLFVDLQNYRDREIHILKYKGRLPDEKVIDSLIFIDLIPYRGLGPIYCNSGDPYIIAAFSGVYYSHSDIQSHPQISWLNELYKSNTPDRVWSLWKLENDSLSFLKDNFVFGAEVDSPIHVSQILSVNGELEGE